MERLDDSPECTSYFWCRPSEVDSETSSMASPYTSTVFEPEDLSYFIPQPSNPSSPQVETPFWDPTCQYTNSSTNVSGSRKRNKATTLLDDAIDTSSACSSPLSSASPTSPSTSSATTAAANSSTATSTALSSKNSAERYKRRQTKMLLVSLIESFCRIYGDSPDANRKVFFLICQTLKSLGIIDTEFIDEMASVRTTFQRTFHKLFYAALHTVQTEPLMEPHRLLLPTNEMNTSFSSSSSSTSAAAATSTQIATPSALVSPAAWLDNTYSSMSSSTNSTASFTTNTTSSTHPHHQRKALFDLSIHHSRYHNDFVELGLLGRGGFAMAYRVKNKLDGIDYAIKKVQLGRDLQKGKTPYKKIFREIKHLARLEHPNVIRYYASWLEYDAGQIQKSDNDSDDFDDELDDSGDDQDYESGITATSIGKGARKKKKKKKELLYQQGSISQPESPTATTDNGKGRITIHGGWTLFIQMQLCQTTLHDYIEIRNRDYGVVDPERNLALFTQILQGTAYIHEQGLIHRDLKPSNIFLTLPSYPSSCQLGNGESQACVSSRILWDECIPKIGDFGLAAALVDEESSPAASSSTSTQDIVLSPSGTAAAACFDMMNEPTPLAMETISTSKGSSNLKEIVQSRRPPLKHRPRIPPVSLRRAHTIGIGTRTYASPEQLQYSGRPYDEKVDIYSLGIIFFELYQPFTTWMERADAISNLKNAMLPDGFVEKFPKESALILWMMDHNPERRPSVKQLLNYEVFSQPPTDMLATLTAKLQAKSEALDTKSKQVEDLQVDVKRMELEKVDMQRRLDELQQKLDSVVCCL